MDTTVKTCDTELNGKKYTAACRNGRTTIFDDEGDEMFTFNDPRALASSEGPLQMFLKLYLVGVSVGEKNGEAKAKAQIRAALGL